MLICNNLEKSFDNVLFSNFDLTVKPGEIIAITGPSGCGKTTLLRCICGLDFIDSGTITLDDNDITEWPAEDRGIGMIFQRPVLFPHLNVRQNLLLGNKSGNVEQSRKEVNMSGFENRSVNNLSGGEGQRISLARALLANPRVLLLDEPFSSIDEELSMKLVEDVRKILKKRQTPAILVTHNKTIARKFADSVISLS